MMWRQVPISAAFVIAAGWEHLTRRGGLIGGGDRMMEVLARCVVGIIVASVVSVVWPLPDTSAAETAIR